MIPLPSLSASGAASSSLTTGPVTFAPVNIGTPAVLAGRATTWLIILGVVALAWFFLKGKKNG